MKIDLFAMPAVPATLEERERLRPIGRSTERYQMMLEELRHLAITADELGIDAFSTTEHHFHTEGNELSVNPILLVRRLRRAHQAHQVRADVDRDDGREPDPRRRGPRDPRPAHEGPRRGGVRARLPEALDAGARPGRADRHRHGRRRRPPEPRALRREHRDPAEGLDPGLDVATRASTSRCRTRTTTGIEGWGAPSYTRQFGTPGEIDDDDVIRKIGVCPRPYQEPHPPIWVPITGGMPSLLNCAQARLAAVDLGVRSREVPRDVRGVPARLGARTATTSRWARTAARSARSRSATPTTRPSRSPPHTTGHDYQEYFGRFGFLELFRNPEDDPNCRPLLFKSNEVATQRMIEKGYQICGTVDQVKRHFEKLVKCHGNGDLEWLSWNFFYQGTTPRHVQDRQLELFATKIMPEFADAFRQRQSPRPLLRGLRRAQSPGRAVQPRLPARPLDVGRRRSRSFAPEYRCITWDERGHGMSECLGPFDYYDSASGRDRHPRPARHPEGDHGRHVAGRIPRRCARPWKYPDAREGAGADRHRRRAVLGRGARGLPRDRGRLALAGSGRRDRDEHGGAPVRPEVQGGHLDGQVAVEAALRDPRTRGRPCSAATTSCRA